jgi:hypothetical protein
MQISEYRKETVLSVQEGLDLIKQNIPYKKTVQNGWDKKEILIDPGFKWYVVQNKAGRRFDFGGQIIQPRQHCHKGGMELGVYIPKYDGANNAIKYLLNDMCDFNYSIRFSEYDNFTEIESFGKYSERVTSKKLFESLDKFIEYIDNKDWATDEILFEEEDYYEVKTRFVIKKL